ncbi:MAG: YciI family protein [Chloroflexota bacterium]
MRFLLLLHGTESTEAELSADERRRIVDEHLTFGRELRDTGRLVMGEALGSSSDAKIVRDGAVVDGPFAETKEQLGGFYVVDAPALDDAIEIARRVPGSPGLAVEVRQISEM